MRFTLPTVLLALTSIATACLGEAGGPRKTGTRDAQTGDATCSKLEKDVTIRSAADIATLPKTGCYDVYGKLILQGGVITSLVMLNELNSVNELVLDHTSLGKIDSKRPIDIYGKLTVTGNAKLTDLKQLTFQTAATGILIDGNTALTSADVLGTDAPPLEEVDGDLVITGNPALTAVSLKSLTKVTGALKISGNTAVKTIDLARLATTGRIELASNPQLTSLTGLAATTINGDLSIHDNAALTSLGTLSSLFRVSGNLTIDNNAALVNLAAFTTSLKRVDLALTISNNPKLTDLGALKHLQLVGAISITNNPALSICRAIELDECVQHVTASVIDNNNDTNCNWQCN